MNLDLGPSSSPGPAIIKALDGNQSLTPTCSSSLSPLQICHCPQDMTHSLSHTKPGIAHHKSGCRPDAARCRVGLCFLLTPGVPQACTWVPLSHLVCQGTGQNHASSSQRDHNSSKLPGASGGSWLARRCCGNPLEGLYTQILYTFI